MPIPAQDIKDSYTFDEVQHMVAREMARNDIDRLKAGALDFQRQLVEIGGATNAELKHLRESLQEFPLLVANQISHCREDMRREMEKDFPDRIEALAMEKRIEDKVDHTDRALSEQITQVSTDLNAKITESNTNLNAKFSSLEGEVKRQWVKITATITAIVAFAGVVTWVLQTAKVFGG
jgi:uncharacterized FlaG/YvyC family protein